MTELTLFAGQQIQMGGKTNMAEALKQSSHEGSTSQLPEGGVYISFSGKRGVYSIGQDSEDANVDECWLVNIYAFERGWMCWKGGQPAAKRMASIYGAPVPTPNFEEHGPFNATRGEGWQQAKAITIKSIDKGRQGYYSTSTKSAVNEFSKLEAEVARRMETGEPCWPVIQLHKDKFTAQGQTNYKPILKVYGWLGAPQVGQLASYESVEEMAAALDDLIDDAERMAKEGTLTNSFDQSSTTADERNGAVTEDDAVEDAEVVTEEPVKEETKSAEAAAEVPPVRRRSRA